MTDDQLKQALETATAAATTAVTAQTEAQRAAEEVAVFMAKIKAYEARRPIIKETTREVSGRTVDEARLIALEAAIADLKAKRAPAPDPRLDAICERLDGIEQRLSDIQMQIDQPVVPQTIVKPAEVVSPAVADLTDRVAAVEELALEMATTPKALAEQLQMTAEIMTAMDERFHAMRAADQTTIELHRQASETAALAQGGLTVVVDSLRRDVDQLTSAVASIRNHIASRDQYRAQIISSRTKGVA